MPYWMWNFIWNFWWNECQPAHFFFFFVFFSCSLTPLNLYVWGYDGYSVDLQPSVKKDCKTEILIKRVRGNLERLSKIIGVTEGRATGSRGCWHHCCGSRGILGGCGEGCQGDLALQAAAHWLLFPCCSGLQLPSLFFFCFSHSLLLSLTYWLCSSPSDVRCVCCVHGSGPFCFSRSLQWDTREDGKPCIPDTGNGYSQVRKR